MINLEQTLVFSCLPLLALTNVKLNPEMSNLEHQVQIVSTRLISISNVFEDEIAEGQDG